MEKIECYATSNTIQKVATSIIPNKTSQFYRISLSQRGKRNDARISLPVCKVGVNPRLTATSSKSSEEAVLQLLSKIKIELIQRINQNNITSDNLFYIFDNISNSISELGFQSTNLITNFHNIVTSVYSYLGTRSVTLSDSSTIVENNDNTNLALCYDINDKKDTSNNFSIDDITTQTTPTSITNKTLTFKEIAIKWFHYKNSFTIKTEDNPNPLSRKTVQDYNKTMNSVIIPYFEDCLDINNLSDDDFQKCIDNTNGSRQKESVYVVLKMILGYAKDNNYLKYARTIKKPPKEKKKCMLKIEGHDFVYIESSRQNIWLDYFEKEKTDVAYLFEGMLLEGFRPEEACGLDWTSLVDNANFFIVREAYKDFPVYNEDAEIIGHIREYDSLKTDESYRKIPVHPRYREILLQHKENQKEYFKKHHLKWSEKTPIFLNRYHQPYVSENLSKALRKFREKYKLEYLTPYGLRHSFATFLSEQGMKDVVLMKLMGHAEYSTTQKYYIFVSDERKKQEYEAAWGIVPSTSDQDTNIIEQNPIAIKVFEQLQKLWIQTLIASTVVQKK